MSGPMSASERALAPEITAADRAQAEFNKTNRQATQIFQNLEKEMRAVIAIQRQLLTNSKLQIIVTQNQTTAFGKMKSSTDDTNKGLKVLQNTTNGLNQTTSAFISIVQAYADITHQNAIEHLALWGAQIQVIAATNNLAQAQAMAAIAAATGGAGANEAAQANLGYAQTALQAAQANKEVAGVVFNIANITNFLQILGGIVGVAGSIGFTYKGLKGLADLASRLGGDSTKAATDFGDALKAMTEPAADLSGMAGTLSSIVTMATKLLGGGAASPGFVASQIATGNAGPASTAFKDLTKGNIKGALDQAFPSTQPGSTFGSAVPHWLQPLIDAITGKGSSSNTNIASSDPSLHSKSGMVSNVSAPININVTTQADAVSIATQVEKGITNAIKSVLGMI